MKVLHIVAGNLTGGAARGAYWLHQALSNFEIKSKILTNSKATFKDDNIISTNQTKRDKLFNFLRGQIDSNMQYFYKNRNKIIFSTGFFGIDFINSKEYNEADIVHLHWINGGFINIKDLSKINKPLIWTIRDMWPMTGGCHYAMECENFKTGCGNCEQLNSNSNFDLSRIVLNRKIKYLPKHTKIVGISNWLNDEAKKSLLFKDFDTRVIFNNINADDFYPIEKNLAKKILGINTNKKIILIGAQNPKSFYKGFDKFLEAIKLLNTNKYFLCFFGNLNKESISKLGFEYKNFGFLYDTISLKLIYSASNVFVAPSIADAFGKTLAEAMSCETPVVCFNATGPKDIVTHRITGYKAIPFKSSDLANGIEWIINNSEYDKLCKNARNEVLKKFDSKVIAKIYIKLYKELLSDNKNNPQKKTNS